MLFIMLIILFIVIVSLFHRGRFGRIYRMKVGQITRDMETSKRLLLYPITSGYFLSGRRRDILLESFFTCHYLRRKPREDAMCLLLDSCHTAMRIPL